LPVKGKIKVYVYNTQPHSTTLSNALKTNIAWGDQRRRNFWHSRSNRWHDGCAGDHLGMFVLIVTSVSAQTNSYRWSGWTVLISGVCGGGAAWGA